MRTGQKALVFTLVVGGLCVFFLRRNTPEPTTAGAKGTPKGTKQQLVLYCAAGIKQPVDEVAREYEGRYPVEIQLQYQGSGTLLSSLTVTRTGDLFLAADQSYLDLAREKDLVAEVLPLARMHPVIGVAKGNPKHIRGLDDLLRKEVRVALGSPEAASIGKQTEKLLTKTGHWARVKEAAVVFKPTVTDLANDLKIGSVDAAVVWDATANQYPEIEAVRVPAFDKATKDVLIGVLNSCKQPTAALRFCRYLGARDKGLQAFAEHGYEVVEGDVWAERPEILFYSGGVNRVAIEDTVHEFEAREGCSVSMVYNGCGILVGQMKAGGRPDAYMACDVSFVPPVADLFLRPQDISSTRIVMLVPKGNPLGLKRLNDLAKPGLKLGLANPEQSTLGALTKRLLEEQGIYAQVWKNVKTSTPTADLLVNQLRAGKGSLDAVVVYKANCNRIGDTLEIVYLPDENAKATQPITAAKGTKYPYLVSRLIADIASAKSRKRFESSGFHWVAPEPKQ
jgi:molybdenum ABC transporter molybdate-binding protein